MSVRTRFAPAVLTGALAAWCSATPGHALVVHATTTHGYVVTDEIGSPAPYEGRMPVGDTGAMFAFLSELTNLLSMQPDPPRADYIALMQTVYENSAAAFYFGLRNDVLGIGFRAPGGGNTERFDLNNLAMTAWPITGLVFLNHFGQINSNFGRYLICTQEFGHRFGVHIRVPPQPGPPLDAGMPDAAVDASTDATPADAADADDAAPNDAAPDDAVAPDAAVADVPPPDTGLPTQASDALLGRQRAHWSYFVHSGGSPMEGNNWTQTSPGVFRTGTPSYRFSTADLYFMGLIPASAVLPFFLIANPDVMGQTDMNRRIIWRESGPEDGRRMITIRGTRIDYTIDDIVRANGPRVPSYETLRGLGPDGGTDAASADAAPRDGGSDSGVPAARPTDMRVVWVLLAGRRWLNPSTFSSFDDAVENCVLGYSDATGRRSTLVEVIHPIVPDGGAADASDVVVARDSGGDAGAVGDASDERPALGGRGGCGCRVAGETRSPGSVALAAIGVGLAFGARRRRRHDPCRG